MPASGWSRWEALQCRAFLHQLQNRVPRVRFLLPCHWQRDEAAIQEAERKYGNILEPSVTVTERDGVQVAVEGRLNQSKTMAFH